MPGIPAGSVVQVTIDYLHFESVLMNVLHYVCVEEATGGATIASETQAIADKIGDDANPASPVSEIIKLIPSSCVLRSVKAQVVSPDRYAYRFKNIYTAGDRGESYTANVDAVVTKRTDSSGYGKQGDMFLPGLDANDAVGALITDAFFTEIETGMQWLKASVVTEADGLYSPVIFHRGTATVTPITSVLPHNTVRVMTRRTLGRGI